MLTPKDLKEFMQKNGINGELLTLEKPTTTVEEAAEALNVSVEQIVKSVLFMIEGEPVLAISCGTQPIDRRKIAAQFNVGRKKVKLADAETVLKETGYHVGTVPPFGHLKPIQTLVDPRVLENEQVYAGGGEHNVLVHIHTESILNGNRIKTIALN